jgi:hypothetical protein
VNRASDEQNRCKENQPGQIEKSDVVGEKVVVEIEQTEVEGQRKRKIDRLAAKIRVQPGARPAPASATKAKNQSQSKEFSERRERLNAAPPRSAGAQAPPH